MQNTTTRFVTHGKLATVWMFVMIAVALGKFT